MLWRKSKPVRSSDPPASVEQRLLAAAAAGHQGDFDAALAIWGELAQAGVARAQAEVGRCFVQGWGVERDVNLARQWLQMAAKSGDAPKIERLSLTLMLGAS